MCYQLIRENNELIFLYSIYFVEFLLNVHILFISFQCHLIDIYFQKTHIIISKLTTFINSRIVNIEINAK